MVDLDNLLFKGSITISLTKDDVLVGSALISRRDGCVPITIDPSQLGFIRNFKIIMNKLGNGNKLYCCGNCMYIGYPESRGPYAEDHVFVSFSDVNAFNFINMLLALENKLSKNDVRRLELTRIGDFYKKIRDEK